MQLKQTENKIAIKYREKPAGESTKMKKNSSEQSSYLAWK